MKIDNLHENNVQEYIDNDLTIRINEKNKYGEVFTPYELIKEILDNLPKSLWSNPDLCWLDPCAGTGNFMILVYVKLMKGLQSSFPNIQKRKDHILSNMIHMVELNPRSVKSLVSFFGKKTNIVQGNFLDSSKKWMSNLGKQKFDIIIGNPPFQTKKTNTYSGSVGNRTLWDKFLEFIFQEQLLNTKGYLGFINPSNWRRPKHDLYSLLTSQNRLKYLHIYGKKDGLEKLKAQTRFDLYIIQEGVTKISKKTKIIDEKGETQLLDLKLWPFLPNFAYKNIQKILVPKEKGIKILFDAGLYDARKLSKNKTKKYVHPIVHNITKRGLGLKYAKEKKKHFKVPKVLLNFNEKQYPINDFDGKYGMSQLTFGIPIKSKKQGNDIILAIESPKFKEILEATKWSSFQTDYRMFSYFDPNFYKKTLFTS